MEFTTDQILEYVLTFLGGLITGGGLTFFVKINRNKVNQNNNVAFGDIVAGGKNEK